MRLAVNPTRMELLRLKRRLILSRRGHKLLKDKQDELMKHFLELVKKEKELRPVVEEKLKRAYHHFLIARGNMWPEVIETVLSMPERRMELEVSMERILNVKVPKYTLSGERFGFSYGFFNTSGDLDTSMTILCETIPLLIELSEVVKSIKLLAHEIKRTKRRVNALEYILIPSLEETISYITMKLSELERSNLTRLMRVKEIVRKS